MLVINNEQACHFAQILRYIPKRIRACLYQPEMEEAEEIRLRAGLPATVYFSGKSLYLTNRGNLSTRTERPLIVNHRDIAEALELICESSVYAVEDRLRCGFVTVGGGHRVGITGTAVTGNDGIVTLNHISGLNYRIAREIVGVSNGLIDSVFADGRVKNTLIVSPPQCGKTTLLRDIIRNISNAGKKVSVLDERGELAAMADGYAGYDLGIGTDVLENAPKAEGMRMLLRSMSPDVIATDELGGNLDIEAVADVIHSGVSILATVHCTDREELFRDKNLSELAGYFSCFITLSRRERTGMIEEVYCVG